MRRPSGLRRAAALVIACLLGGLGAGSLFASVALADDGSASAPTPAPISVTIPSNGTNGSAPTPTPSSTPSSSPSMPPGNQGGGGNGGVTTPPHQPGTEPSIPKHPATGTLKVTIEPRGVFGPGDRITVTATGFDPKEKVQLVLYYEHGKPVKIGNFAADASGSFSQTFLLPKLDAGTDIAQLTGWDSSKVATGSFLLGASWVAATTSSERAIWIWVGGLAGLAAIFALIWFGVVSLRRAPAVEAGV
jgi:hypothetical protein